MRVGLGLYLGGNRGGGAPAEPGQVLARLERLVITPYPAAVGAVTNIAASVEALAITPQPATIALAYNVAASSEALAIAGLQATISQTTAVSPTISDIIFTDNNDGTPADLQIQGGYTGADTIDATLEFYQGVTLHATATVSGITVTSNSFDVTVTISEGDLTYEAGSDASDIANVDSIEVTVFERNNGGSVGPTAEPVSGLSAEPPVITWATNSTGTEYIGTGNKALYFSQDTADWSFGGVTAGTPTVVSVTGSGTTTITITVSTNLPANGDTLTISYTDSDTNLRGPDGNEVANFAGTSVTNNVSGAAAAWEARQSLTASNGGTGRYSFPITFTGDEVFVVVNMLDKNATPLQIRRVLYNDGGADVALLNLNTVRNDSNTLNMAAEWTNGTPPSAGAGQLIVETWDGTTLTDVTAGVQIDAIQTPITTIQHDMDPYSDGTSRTHTLTNATPGAIALGVAMGSYLATGGTAPNANWSGAVTEDGTEFTFDGTGAANNNRNMFSSRAIATGVAAGSVNVTSVLTSGFRQSLAAILINP